MSKNEIKKNDEYAQHHLKLNMFKNIDRTGFSPEAKQHFNIESNQVKYIDGAEFGLDDGL